MILFFCLFVIMCDCLKHHFVALVRNKQYSSFIKENAYIKEDRVKHMIIVERHEKILALLEKRQQASVSELSDLLLVSPATIRRDLADLEKLGQVTRVYGGAVLSEQYASQMHEQTINEKQSLHQEEKQVIAQQAVLQVRGGETIYLDAGTTTACLIPLLAQVVPKVTVVTNSVNHAAKLADLSVAEMVIGGSVKLATNAVIGSNAVQKIQQLHFDRSFLGINGVTADAGLTTPDIEEATMKRAVMAQSRKNYVLADASKIGAVNFVKVNDVNEAVLVTNQTDQSELDAIRKQTQVIISEA